MQQQPLHPDGSRTSVGRVQPHLEAKVVDTDGNGVPAAKEGGLCTKVYSVMRGYRGDDLRTQEVVRDGRMHTGDFAALDAEGLVMRRRVIDELELSSARTV